MPASTVNSDVSGGNDVDGIIQRVGEGEILRAREVKGERLGGLRPAREDPFVRRTVGGLEYFGAGALGHCDWADVSRGAQALCEAGEQGVSALGDAGDVDLGYGEPHGSKTFGPGLDEADAERFGLFRIEGVLVAEAFDAGALTGEAIGAEG